MAFNGIQHSAPIERVRERLSLAGPGCWVWPGATNGVGYGVVGKRKPEGGWTNSYVHRVVYEHIKGAIPEGLVLDHLCRNPICCNPDHLEPVTHRTNLLRGETRTAMFAARTCCNQGHLFDDVNTSVRPDGSRKCLTCNRERVSAYRATAIGAASAKAADRRYYETHSEERRAAARKYRAERAKGRTT